MATAGKGKHQRARHLPIARCDGVVGWFQRRVKGNQQIMFSGAARPSIIGICGIAQAIAKEVEGENDENDGNDRNH